MAAEIDGMMPSVVTSCWRGTQSLLKNYSELEGFDYPRGLQKNVSESPARDVMRMLMDKRAYVYYNDPFVPALGINFAIDWAKSCLYRRPRLYRLHTDRCRDFRKMVAAAKFVVDTRKVTKDLVEFKAE
jgi:UDP-N-acetyl-D-mannosaminuronate dehydrogenase